MLPVSDQVAIVLIAAGWASAVGIVGLGLAWALRRASLRWLPLLVAVVAVGAVVGGVVGTSRAMFVSEHDLSVVLLVCLVAGAVAAAFAFGVGSSLARWSGELREGARAFGEQGEYVASSSGPAELASVSAELQRTSLRLGEARRREQRLEESRRELVSWVSHDLRTPLAGLRAMTEALEDGLAPDPDRYHRQMRGEVDRMVRMVDDLFELSRIHAGVLETVVEPVPVGDLVSEALAGADPVARRSGVALSGEVDPGLVLHGDPAALSRVVGNLLMNAIRHTPADGEVRVVARGQGPTVALEVSDACGGIPEEDLGRVFDVAWRGSSARTPEASADPSTTGAGAGLGLAIVRGLVEAHRGRVSVENAGSGCRFVVEFPV